jgi:transposase-like protein
MNRRAGQKKTTRVVRLAIGTSARLEPRRFFLQAWRVYPLFPTESVARVYLEQALWPNGPVCPHCKSGAHVGSGKAPYRCNACDRQFTVRIGTIFEGSHVPLQKWFHAILILTMVPHRQRLSSIVLAKMLRLRRPTVTLMLRKIRAIWDQRETVLAGILNDKRLEFIEDPGSGSSWPFFSDHTKPQPVQLKKEDAVPADTYSLEPEDDLVGMIRAINPDFKWHPLPRDYDSEEARARAQGPLYDAYERAGIQRPDNAREVRVTGLQVWQGISPKQLKGYIRLREGQFRFQQRRHERAITHREDHLRRMPFSWMCQRDCPLCRFGAGEWERWAAIAVVLPLDTWLPFWDWIAEVQEFTDHWYEKWDDDAPWTRETERRLGKAGLKVRVRYERFVGWVEERRHREYEERELLRLARLDTSSAEDEDVLI